MNKKKGNILKTMLFKINQRNKKIKTNNNPILLYICVILFWFFPTYAEENDLITDRPDFTESASAVPLGSWQFEMGYTFEKSNDVTNHTLGELLVRYSPLDKFEFRFGFNSFALSHLSKDSFNGFEDIQLGLKYEIVQDQIAILISTSLPTGSDNFGSSRFQPELKLALAQDINDFLSMGVNFGIANIYEEKASIVEYSASLAIGMTLNSKWSVYIEYYAFFYNNNGKNQHYVNGGFTYLLSKLFQIDFRLGQNLNKGESTYFFGCGASIRF